MAMKNGYIIALFLKFVCVILLVVGEDDDNHKIRRSDFPKSFLFGTSSSAYQYEGGISTRGRNNWDNYTHQYPERIADRSNGDVALEGIHRYKEDILLYIHKTGFNAFRFSLSWTRILKDGTLKGGVNKKGVDYYNDLIDCLLEHGITPIVTLFHWEVPHGFEGEFKSFLDFQMVKYFTDFVDLCFKIFGDRVKHWITLNEPNTFTINGYATGNYAPGRCSEWEVHNCLGGNSATEPYIVGHNLILAHAHAVNLYRKNYQKRQKGVIGITVLSDWYVPFTETMTDKEAASRAVDFFSGWFFNPVVHGDYPESMRKRVKERLPQFSKEERILIKGSFDFLGVNYYTTNYAINDDQNFASPSYLTDSGATTSSTLYDAFGFVAGHEVPIGPKVNASSWLSVYPQGLKEALVDIQEKYNDPPIFITENGYFDYDGPDIAKLVDDKNRTDYYKKHLYYLHKAMKENGVRVKGFFAWTLLDDFEWLFGYTQRFGLTFVDYKHNLTRIPKQSLKWFTNFLKN